VRVLVVGMNPGNRKIKSFSNLTPFHQRLNSWMKFMKVEMYSFVNVQQDSGKFFPLESDLDFFFSIISLNQHERIVALGERVSSILSKNSIAHFKLPHPSGLNRKLNDRTFVEKTLIECRKYINV